MDNVPFEAVCPHCHSKHDMAASMTPGTTPTEGDLSVCFECGTVSKFALEMPGNLVALTVTEFTAACAEFPDIISAVDLVSKINKEIGKVYGQASTQG